MSLLRAESVSFAFPQAGYGLAHTLVSYIIFGALGGLLGGLTLIALRKAGFFAYLAEKR
jgi:tetrahydromethanopterin S-methyltransferase subunit D